MQYGNKLSTEHQSETNINFKKIVFKITHFLNKNKRFYNIPVKIKILRYQNNTGLKYFADIRFGMFVVEINRQEECSLKCKFCNVLKMT